MTPCSSAMEIIIASFRGKLVRPLFFSVAGEGAAVNGFNQLSGSALLWWEISTHQLPKYSWDGYTIFVAYPMEHFMFYRLMAGEFRGWLIPNSSLSSAVSNFQRISSLLVGPFVCWKRRSFFIHRSTRSGRILRFNCLGLLWYGLFSIGRFL